MSDNDFRVYDLPLLLKLFVLGYFLQIFTHFDQLSVQLVYLGLLSQLHQMSFIMCIKINRNRLVLAISWCKTNVSFILTTYFCFTRGSTQYLSLAGIVRYYLYSRLLRGLTSNLIWKFNCLSRLLIKLETKRTCWNSKINWIYLA